MGRLVCIPVRWQGELVAVLTRESALSVGRRPGELERVYVEVFDRFARMISNGEFPFPIDDLVTSEAPRVGDGVLVLDATGRVEYGSPNAINALHRMGMYSNIEGMRLDEAGIDETAVSRAFSTALPVTEEVERRPDVTVLTRCIPLLESGAITGALVLMRDVSDLRRRDRLLLSKDAAIREVHHRVKNNLQTISSLLRLQSRRLDAGEGKDALEEAERRVRSIALVHEILSREATDQVDFNEILPSLVRMAEDLISPEHPVGIGYDGEAGELPAEVATPLAVILTELLQNAAEHAFPENISIPPDAQLRVQVSLRREDSKLRVEVRDNGIGLPDGFSVEGTGSLGLSIVRDLVGTQLSGTITMYTDRGTVVELLIPYLAPDLLAQAEQPGQVVDVGVEVGHGRDHVGGGGQLLALLGLALGHDLEVQEALGHLAQDPLDHGRVLADGAGDLVGHFGAAAAEPLGPGRRPLVEEVRGQHLVEHERAEVELLAGEHVDEELGLVHRRRLEGGDDDERGALVVQQPGDRLGPAARTRRTSSGTG